MINKTINRPAAHPATSDAMVPDSIFFREFMPTFAMRLGALLGCMSRDCFSSGGTRVKSLLPSGSPPAIIWSVISVVIYAIKRVAKWARPHIGKKVSKTFSAAQMPSFANKNSSATPMFVVWLVGIGTPLDHVGPGAI